jgi:hypothetical protein
VKTIFIRSTSLLLGITLLSTGFTFADTYRGDVRLRGSVQNEAKPGSISFVITGTITNRQSGNQAAMTGGGLFRSNSERVVNTSFTGPLKIKINDGGNKITSNRKTTIRVSRRTVTFRGAKIRLDRPLSASELAKQRIRGTGTIVVRG